MNDHPKELCRVNRCYSAWFVEALQVDVGILNTLQEQLALLYSQCRCCNGPIYAEEKCIPCFDAIVECGKLQKTFEDPTIRS